LTTQGYRDLGVWKKAMATVKSVYLVTQKFPKEEIYALTSQMRRAAVSIPSNIAEGKSRFSDKEFARFLLIARGSVAELETQILISQDLGYIPAEQVEAFLRDITEIGRMLSGLISTLNKDQS
jgi:four helix bundle protein